MKISEYIELLQILLQDAYLWFNYNSFDWYEPWIPEVVSADDAKTDPCRVVKEGDFVISMV